MRIDSNFCAVELNQFLATSDEVYLRSYVFIVTYVLCYYYDLLIIVNSVVVVVVVVVFLFSLVVIGPNSTIQGKHIGSNI